MRPWEEDLVDRYQVNGARTPMKGPWIRNFLLEHPGSNVTSIHNAWKRFCGEAGAFGVRIRVGSTGATSRYLYLLRRRGLVRRRRVSHPTKLIPYSLYFVVHEMLGDTAWENPARGV